ncbi:hypothetical protein WME79_19635 [Sorangium sp. So ce726]|uniref:hypothetical protein n=1 Tax=Sorangium sp. So ce726 TaxID=3133319 RepID=UPI003F610C25
MGTSPKPTTWIGSGAIAIAALAAAYNLGRISAESDNGPQSHQAAASKDDPDLRSTLRVTRKRLASCEKTLQRRDQHLQKRDGDPHTNDDNPILPLESGLPTQCIIRSQAIQLHMLAENCRDFRWQINAYEQILGSSTLDCGTVLSIRDLAQTQHSTCVSVIRSFEDASQPDVTSDILGLDAMENAYMFRDEHGDVDIDKLVKNSACIARMQAP